MSDAPVLYQDDGTIVTSTLNRPENRNSMTPDLVAAFQDAVRRVRESREVRVVIVAGGGTTFCGGADFRSLDREGHPLEVRERVYGTYEASLPLVDVEVPILAAMTGHAIGGGLGPRRAAHVESSPQAATLTSDDAREGIAALLEKRPPVFHGR